MKRIYLLLVCLLILFSMSLSGFADDRATGSNILTNGSTLSGGATGDYDLALYIGSPLTISGGVITPLDSDNPNVAPIIYKDRTLIPLRAVAEHFGAIISYVPAQKAAIIKYNDITTTFFVGKNYYIQAVPGKEDQTFTFDTEMVIKENRSMVPLRVICENILNKKVDYSQRIITISEETISLASATQLKADIKSKIGQAIKITSRAQLEGLIANNMQYYGQEMLKNVDMISPSEEGNVAAPDSTQAQSAVTGQEGPGDSSVGTDAAQDYSSTNTQVEGIDEADIMKTDGDFIYIAAGGYVKVIKADNGSMTLTDTIKMPLDPKTGQNINITELYIDEGRLIVLGSFWQGNVGIMYNDLPVSSVDGDAGFISGSSTGSSSGSSSGTVVDSGPLLMEKSIAIYPPIWQGKSYVYCGIYSVDTLGKTALLKELSVEGDMLSSRKNGDTLYIMSNKYFYTYGIENPGEIIPMVKDTSVSQNFTELPIDNIMCYPESLSPQYLMVTAVDVMKTDEAANIEAILGSGSTVYMNDANLYVAQSDYSDTLGEMTSITKFSLNGTKIGFAGGGKVKGSLLNQFSMDEFDGNLRVATTAWGQNSTNAVYILDENLNQIGALENLATGERIFAVRFMGAKGYIVTFRQIDPLFVIELSVPTKPVVTGELKVPGFSNFLYPIGENLLLGVGQGTEDIYSKDSLGKEVVIGSRQTGIKFSIFDVSDQGKPKELHTYTVGESGSYSELLYNHKALMFNQKDNILAFDATLQNYSSVKTPEMSDYFNGAVVLSYNMQTGFSEEGRIAYKASVQEGPDIGYYSNIRRLCYIGDVLYYIQDNLVRSFNMDTLTPISTL
jgi:uncharacterized secreted protein with C-terminal beta-propeller domain